VVNLGIEIAFKWNGTSIKLGLLLGNTLDRAYYTSANGAMRALVGAPSWTFACVVRSGRTGIWVAGIRVESDIEIRPRQELANTPAAKSRC